VRADLRDGLITAAEAEAVYGLDGGAVISGLEPEAAAPSTL